MGAGNSTEMLTTNDIHNYVSNKISNVVDNSNKTEISSLQEIKVDGFSAYELWVKYGQTGPPPKCTVKNVELSTATVAKSDIVNQQKVTNELNDKLKSVADQLAKNNFDQEFGILNKLDSETRNQIKNNIETIVENKSISSVVNTILTKQVLDIKCGFDTVVDGIRITSVTDMAAKNITDQLTKNTKIVDVETQAKQDVENKTRSVISQMWDGLTGLFKEISTGWIVFILIFGLVIIVLIRSPKVAMKLLGIAGDNTAAGRMRIVQQSLPYNNRRVVRRRR